jgi:putative mRNA 3-end processing factor
MLTLRPQGLFCEAGGFHIDPSRGVDRAVITHAHSDHARAGSRAYLCAAEGLGVLRVRLGSKAVIEGSAYGRRRSIGGVTVSFHPAGHVLGSAQVRVEHRGEVWVVSGDYKTQPDPTCTPLEVVRCHTFVTESTFALPVYQWPVAECVYAEIGEWWRDNRERGRTSVLFGYSLGKAQRLLAGLGSWGGRVLVHPAVHGFLPAYSAAGVQLPRVEVATRDTLSQAAGRALVITPPAAAGLELGMGGEGVSTAAASGWMLLARNRRRQGIDRGFTLSDHVDWPGLVETIRETGASRVLVMHGTTDALVRWLRENGRDADVLA